MTLAVPPSLACIRYTRCARRPTLRRPSSAVLVTVDFPARATGQPQRLPLPGNRKGCPYDSPARLRSELQPVSPSRTFSQWFCLSGASAGLLFSVKAFCLQGALRVPSRPTLFNCGKLSAEVAMCQACGYEPEKARKNTRDAITDMAMMRITAQPTMTPMVTPVRRAGDWPEPV